MFGSGAISTDASYDVRIAVTDTHTIDGNECTAYRYLTLSQAFFTMDFLNGGHGVAMGTAATKTGAFELAMDFDHSGGVSLDATAKAAWLAALGAPFLRFSEVTTATQSIASGGLGYFDVEAPIYTGYTLRGAIQAWASGSGVIIGASYRSSRDNHMHFVVRANNSASVVVKALLLYTLDAITS